MTRSGKRALWACMALSLGAGLAHAHHSYARYDSGHQVKLTGTVTSFNWSNPHVYISLAVREERGTLNTFILECAGPGVLQRQGWHFNLIKPGDTVSVIIAPLKSGDPGGLVKELILANGRRLSAGVLVGPPNIQ